MFKRSPFRQFMALSLYLHRKLIFWLAIGLGLIFLFTANMGPSFSPLYSIGLFVGGALISVSAFKDVHDKNLNIQYLTLPISAWARYLAMWLMTGPFYLMFITVLYGVGILAHVIVQTFWDFGSAMPLLYTAGQYLVVNAIFLLGSISFKRLPFIKTIFWLLLLGLAVAVVRSLISNMDVSASAIKVGDYTFWLVFGICAWFIAYYKLKKSELR